jgi:FKBP-type peptidyl-prolyl cis-trans isomerase (trigger factor)
VRHDLLRDLSSRVKTVPDSLVEAEIDRRLEDFVRRLMEQGVDPMQAGIDWQQFRTQQREPALETVLSAVTEQGRVGVTAVGDSPEDARELWESIRTALKEEAQIASRDPGLG